MRKEYIYKDDVIASTHSEYELEIMRYMATIFNMITVKHALDDCIVLCDLINAVPGPDMLDRFLQEIDGAVKLTPDLCDCAKAAVEEVRDIVLTVIDNFCSGKENVQ